MELKNRFMIRDGSTQKARIWRKDNIFSTERYERGTLKEAR